MKREQRANQRFWSALIAALILHSENVALYEELVASKANVSSRDMKKNIVTPAELTFFPLMEGSLFSRARRSSNSLRVATKITKGGSNNAAR